MPVLSESYLRLASILGKAETEAFASTGLLVSAQAHCRSHQFAYLHVLDRHRRFISPLASGLWSGASDQVGVGLKAEYKTSI